MEILSREEFTLEKARLGRKILMGALFIHPTDTIYGIGCDATNPEAVRTVRDVKQREDTPFSVIAPSKEWIRENCELLPNAENWIEKLPGPYTLILPLKKMEGVAQEVNAGRSTLGVRIPDHWFSGVVEELGIPVVTTSANIHGHEFMTSLDDLSPLIAAKMSFAIFEGEKRGRPSKIVDLTTTGGRIIKR